MKAIYESHYLSDKDVANYARQSFAKLADNFTEDQNNQLIRFLARGMSSQDWESLINKLGSVNDPQQAKELAVYLRKIPEHWVPFGHPHISIRVEAPIPIRVQCFKHKIGFVESEESRRYISSTPSIFIPEFREVAPNKKQGSGGLHPASHYWKAVYMQRTNEAVDSYLAMIDGGVCPEQARFILPQGCEVNWVWTGSLYAYANFYNQRTDPHVQKETVDLATEIGKIIEPLYPVSWSALTEGDY